MTPLQGLNEDFRDLLACLSREGAEYVLVGAYDAGAEGVSMRRKRATAQASPPLTDRTCAVM